MTAPTPAPRVLPSEPLAKRGHALGVPDELLTAVAERVAECLAERLPATQPEPYLDVDQAADYLACKPARIYELKAAGRLDHWRDGRRLLFRRTDLDAALERVERCHPVATPSATPHLERLSMVTGASRKRASK